MNPDVPPHALFSMWVHSHEHVHHIYVCLCVCVFSFSALASLQKQLPELEYAVFVYQ